MNKLLIGRSRLSGEVVVSGAKNSVLRLMAASLLTDEDVSLSNYPAGLLDAQVHQAMLDVLGKSTAVHNNVLKIVKNKDTCSVLDWDQRSIRNTLLILGALTAKTGSGSVPLPGGCDLGGRAYDLHEMLLRELGAEVWVENGSLCAYAPQGLVGTDIYLPIRSTGATENAIISATLAKGTTRIWNPHIRPEILNLVKFINVMGGDVTVFGQEHIKVVGVEGLRGADFEVMPDNMEAITWLVASVMTKGDVEIKHFPIQDLEVALIHLRESGAKFYKNPDGLIVRGGVCYPLEISTGPHPGINSDVQPLLAAYGAAAIGESRIVDLRFPGRYDYVKEMEKLGVDYEIKGNLLVIKGKGGAIRGGTVTALDLRAGASLALCGLIADTPVKILDSWQIERGYNNFVEKLIALGGDVTVE